MPRKHIIVPLDIWYLEDINVTERLVASVVYGYTKQGNPCFMTNTGFSKLLRISKRTAQRAVNVLLEKGYLEAVEGSQQRHLKCRSCLGGVDTSVQGGESPVSIRNIESNKELNHKTNKMNSEIIDLGKRASRWQDIRDYFVRLNDLEGTNYHQQVAAWAKECFTYYEARDWKTKQGEIKQWRPIAQAWYRRASQRVPQRAVQRRDEVQLREDLRWHQRRLDNYLEQGRRDLAYKESMAIKHINDQLNEQ